MGLPILAAWIAIAAAGVIVQAMTHRDAVRDWRNWHAYNGRAMLPLLQLHLLTARLRGSVVVLNLLVGLAYLVVPRPTRASMILGILVVFALLYDEAALVWLAVQDRRVRRRVARTLGLPTH